VQTHGHTATVVNYSNNNKNASEEKINQHAAQDVTGDHSKHSHCTKHSNSVCRI